ncbi:universal stress protein [Yoonia sp. 2307UL14-13]|uniref:universal stress protein n=1 Tax=Yoonia sp. 2307UL14-13 TaxID=3126506 RepID=UPI0030AAB4A1
MKHFLAAIDGSEASYRALSHAAELARNLNAALTVVIVRLIIVSRKGTYSAMTEDEVQAIAAQAGDVAARSGVTQPEIVIETSRDTSFTIVQVGIDKEVDLIVMGATGKTGFKAFLLGSVSQEVLRKAACPVTIVH